ncbi:MAG TPA: hypothetical protein VG983_02085, partial [Caulobacterales bacterium]|nr:hypothetical protein [Caulobacterales bacterium]
SRQTGPDASSLSAKAGRKSGLTPNWALARALPPEGLDVAEYEDAMALVAQQIAGGRSIAYESLDGPYRAAANALIASGAVETRNENGLLILSSPAPRGLTGLLGGGNDRRKRLLSRLATCNKYSGV